MLVTFSKTATKQTSGVCSYETKMRMVRKEKAWTGPLPALQQISKRRDWLGNGQAGENLGADNSAAWYADIPVYAVGRP